MRKGCGHTRKEARTKVEKACPYGNNRGFIGAEPGSGQIGPENERGVAM